VKDMLEPGDVINTAVADFLLELADDFVDSVTKFSCKLASHRNSRTLDVKDIATHLERAWEISLPRHRFVSEVEVCERTSAEP
jgi:transcription initiation factor TFIID subunit 12